MNWDPDVLVVGGGAAGVAAAVASARGGAQTLLVERFGSLGGTLTQVSLGSLCGYFAVTSDVIRPIVGGVAQEVVDRLGQIGGVGSPQRWLETASLPYDIFPMRLVLDRIVQETTGLTVLLHAQTGPVTLAEDGTVATVALRHQGGDAQIQPQQIIDCSGDGDIAAAAGCDFEFDAQASQSATAMFRLGGVDSERVQRLSRAELHAALATAREAGHELPRTAGGIFTFHAGMVHLNLTKLDPFDPFDPVALTHAEMVGREQVSTYLSALREHVPGFSQAYVVDVGAMVGIRESRRIKGRDTLDAEYVRALGRHSDSIGCCAWPIEVHPAGQESTWEWIPNGGYYQIPFGTMVPRGPANLLVAGRCISATTEAHASVRVAAQCFAMGEAAGAAAALACRADVPVAEVEVAPVQEVLRGNGAFLGEVA